MSNAIELIEEARGQWPYILEAAGIDPSFLTRKHGPCPICGGKDRFRFDNKENRGTYICNQCGAGNGFQLLKSFHGWSSKEACEFIHRQLHSGPEHIGSILKRTKIIQRYPKKQENLEYKRKQLNDIWIQSQPITLGDSSDRYLKSRGIILQSWPSNLRTHPSLTYWHEDEVIGKFPAIIGMIQDQHSKKITVHRTYLCDSCKADVPEPKKLMPPIVAGSSLGGAIKLYPPTNDGTLAIAEGIETALAFYIATGFPVWATVSALGMERIILPAKVSNVIIAVDNDYSGTGQKAAAELASRLLQEGRKVRCVMPPNVGNDFADLLLEDR